VIVGEKSRRRAGIASHLFHPPNGYVQPFATLMLAGSVAFLGFQQGKASATKVIFPSDVSVSISDMPGLHGSVHVTGELGVRNGVSSRRGFRISGL